MRSLFLLLMILILLVSGCTVQSNSQKYSSDFPEEVKTQIEKLPENIQLELEYPTKFPSEPVGVSFSNRKSDIVKGKPSGDISSTEFTYAGGEEGWILHVTTWHSDTSNLEEITYETINLNNGTEANIVKDSHSKILEWVNEKGNLNSLVLIEDPDNIKYTIDDLVKVANSMIDRQ